jgi:hypothetical protein
MIRLHRGTGSAEIQLLGKSSNTDEWQRQREMALRLLWARKEPSHAKAAEIFETLLWELYDGTNSFNDEFRLLFYNAPLERYVELAHLERDAASQRAISAFVAALEEIGFHVRFVVIGLARNHEIEAVRSPSPQVTSDAVERALADAEQLLATRGASSGVDRVHTAFHAYLLAHCRAAHISIEGEPGITQLFKLLRQQHPSFGHTRPRAADIGKIAGALASIVDALDPIRNRASGAHPNEAVLENPEAMLVINTVRTLLHYIDTRLDID